LGPHQTEAFRQLRLFFLREFSDRVGASYVDAAGKVSGYYRSRSARLLLVVSCFCVKPILVLFDLDVPHGPPHPPLCKPWACVGHVCAVVKHLFLRRPSYTFIALLSLHRCPHVCPAIGCFQKPQWELAALWLRSMRRAFVRPFEKAQHRRARWESMSK
jgi:hypothetical protein